MCISGAITVLCRQTTAEERKQTTVNTAQGVSWAHLVEFRVCGDHVKQAQAEYPHIANKEP